MKNRHTSHAVSSSQQGVHPRLTTVVDAHLRRPWQAPLHPPSVDAFDALQAQLGGDTLRLVLDSGCGTGASTRLIARALPDCRTKSSCALPAKTGICRKR